MKDLNDISCDGHKGSIAESASIDPAEKVCGVHFNVAIHSGGERMDGAFDRTNPLPEQYIKQATISNQ